jgi:RNA recognition motif-containing protein
VIYNPHTGASKRFGYVEFFEKESVDKVLAEPQVLFLNKKVVVNRYAPKAYLEKQKEGSILAARTGSQNQADCDPVKGALDSPHSDSTEISQNSVNKRRDGDLKTKDLTQQIFNQNPNFTNCAN